MVALGNHSVLATFAFVLSLVTFQRLLLLVQIRTEPNIV
jgi:hypothetical protein